MGKDEEGKVYRIGRIRKKRSKGLSKDETRRC